MVKLVQNQSSSVRVYIKLSVMALSWGGAFIAGRILMQSVSPFTAAFWRYAIATLCLLALTIKREGSLPKLKQQDVLLISVLGLSGIFAYNALFFLGLQTVNASRASLIVAANPTVITLCSAWLLKDTLTPLKLSGVMAAFMGAMIVISQGQPSALLAQGVSSGDLYLLGGVFSWTIYTLVGKRVIKTLSPLVATTYACLIGTPIFLILALQEGVLISWQAFSTFSWLSILYLALLGTVVAFCWYYEGVSEIGATRAAVFSNLVPVISVLLAALLLHEPLTPAIIGGGLLVVLGVSLINQK